MKGAVWRLLVLGALASLAVVVVGGGNAGPRAAAITFDAFPGPAEVTYGEYIAYRATFENTSGSTLTKVKFRQRYPVASSVYATFVRSTCPTTPTTISTSGGPELICDFGTLAAGAAPVALTVVWQVPTLGPNANCPDCLVTNGRWTVKEGTNDVGDPNDSFPPGGKTVTATLLASGPGGSELLRAGGYETGSASCSGTSPAGNLRTNPDVNLGNPVSTTICLPSFTGSSTDPGYATTITEIAGNARHSEVCIADLGTNCVAGYVDENFFPASVTHVFRVSDAALGKGERITQVSHNGFTLSSCPNTDPNGCVVSITLDNRTKIWTIVARSPSNGQWGWD